MTEDDLDALLGKLGTTEKAMRAVVAHGARALDPLDAIVRDASQPLHRRQAASLAAHMIREQAMRAPGAPPRGANYATNRFPPGELEAFLDELRVAGAILLTWTDDATLVVTLPLTPVRAAVFAIYNREVDSCGESFGGEEHVDDDLHAQDVGQATLTFWWD